eukprot:13649109-Heterocapsa_arctica.AAC.1
MEEGCPGYAVGLHGHELADGKSSVPGIDRWRERHHRAGDRARRPEDPRCDTQYLQDPRQG